MRRGSTLHKPTEPHQQGPDLHEDSSPWATTRQRNTKDPYDLISSNSKIRALERRETTGRHEFTARRLAELSLGARHAGRGFEPSSPRFAPGPRRTPCVKYILYTHAFGVTFVACCRVPHWHPARQAGGQTRLGTTAMLGGDAAPGTAAPGQRSSPTDDLCHVLALPAGAAPPCSRRCRAPPPGVLAALVLGIVLGVVVIREKRGRDTRCDAEGHGALRDASARLDDLREAVTMLEDAGRAARARRRASAQIETALRTRSNPRPRNAAVAVEPATVIGVN